MLVRRQRFSDYFVEIVYLHVIQQLRFCSCKCSLLFLQQGWPCCEDFSLIDHLHLLMERCYIYITNINWPDWLLYFQLTPLNICGLDKQILYPSFPFMLHLSWKHQHEGRGPGSKPVTWTDSRWCCQTADIPLMCSVGLGTHKWPTHCHSFCILAEWVYGQWS